MIDIQGSKTLKAYNSKTITWRFDFFISFCKARKNLSTCVISSKTYRKL